MRTFQTNRYHLPGLSESSAAHADSGLERYINRNGSDASSSYSSEDNVRVESYRERSSVISFRHRGEFINDLNSMRAGRYRSRFLSANAELPPPPPYSLSDLERAADGNRLAQIARWRIRRLAGISSGVQQGLNVILNDPTPSHVLTRMENQTPSLERQKKFKKDEGSCKYEAKNGFVDDEDWEEDDDEDDNLKLPPTFRWVHIDIVDAN